MDNKKIGKLIAELRKKNGLTQQELGDKVGVGFRAVSKWERGITLPDISIINELSKILGISSDELLSGKLKKENKTKKKLSNKIKKPLITLIAIIVVIISTILFYNNKTYTYNIVSTSDEYRIDGKAILNKNNLSILINNLNIFDKDILSTKIQNYDYLVFLNDKLIIGYGYNPAGNILYVEDTIEKFTNNFTINHDDTTTFRKKELDKGKLKIIINFTDENNQEIKQEIKCTLELIKI